MRSSYLARDMRSAPIVLSFHPPGGAPVRGSNERLAVLFDDKAGAVAA